ncbi:hypothetical protein [Spirulina sp. CCNP1310]|uniref:hypothetical protein n=1 Tax=Spirulina sp. CCNP1310 TaxID=3110249 RepID=UPI002B2067AE|nr:hypothetical protein [Spirulina sp. CCNP1310]
MPLQPLQLCSLPDVRVVGNVEIHPSAAIASGAVLLTGSQGRVVIGPGVCIGMGVILNAIAGTICIEEGASLGPGVLVVGSCAIGANSCIGGLTTIYERNIPAMAVIPAGTVLGDCGRPVDLAAPDPMPLAADLLNGESEADFWEDEPTPELQTPEPSAPEPAVVALNLPDDPPSPPPSERLTASKMRINQLLVTLFPYDQRFQERIQENGHQNEPKPEDSSP